VTWSNGGWLTQTIGVDQLSQTWSRDGTRLLYIRKFEDHAGVRVVSLDGKLDELLVTGLTGLSCYYGGCRWSQILAYHPSDRTI
jgi:hypothetical protein